MLHCPHCDILQLGSSHRTCPSAWKIKFLGICDVLNATECNFFKEAHSQQRLQHGCASRPRARVAVRRLRAFSAKLNSVISPSTFHTVHNILKI
jgi:hypothetical protein